MDDPVLRRDLVAGYERPYARWLPIAWQVNSVPLVGGGAAVLALAAGATELLLDGAPGGLVFVAVLAAVAALVWTLWTTAVAIQVIRARVRDWRPRDSELARVRVRRPHAGEADPHVAHDEFAVAVEDGGELVAWRFRPLTADVRPRRDALLLPGAPSYVATEAGRVAFAAEDAVLAAEQLAEAQADAARREAEAARQARERLGAAERRRELARETESTAQALRRHTGQ